MRRLDPVPDLDEIRTRQTLAEPQPEFLSIVPYSDEAKTPRIRLKSMSATHERWCPGIRRGNRDSTIRSMTAGRRIR